MAPTYALRVSASAAFTDCIIVLNADVSVSTSRLKPVSGERVLEIPRLRHLGERS